MIRSMLAAVSGMRNHQAFLDVIGNNIANVNTVGFKASRVLFADVMGQLTRGASSPQNGRGGINPTQIGLGTEIAGVDTLQSQGSMQSTGKNTDLAIQGDGFFVLNDGAQNLYTRDGAFDVGVDGTLVSPTTGMRVQGWQADANGKVDTTSPTTAISIPFGETLAGQPSTKISMRGNLDTGMDIGTIVQSNSTGGKAVVSGTYSGPAGAGLKVKIASVDNTGQVTGIQVSNDGGATYGATIATSGGNPVSIGDGLSFSIGTAAGNAAGDTYSFPAVQANVNVYDSLGTVHSVLVNFTRTGQNAWSWTASTSEPGVTIAAGSGNISFDSTGAYTGQTPAGSIQLALTNGAKSPASINLDLSSLSQMSGASDVNASTDGAAAGSLVSFSIGQAGDITGVYSNGLSKMVGQIAIAKFANPAGLVSTGKNLYQVSANSGAISVGAAGQSGRGEINSGSLEMSNVDLALQFTNMIMAERGFEANSKVITASDELLQDLVNLKR